MEIDNFTSPIGVLCLKVEEDFLREIVFVEDEKGPHSSHPVLGETRKQLQEYFEGQRNQFDLPLKPRGTDFQQRVWDVLAGIPFGSTVTYRYLSEKLGDPNSIRAVGRANGQNPLPIVIPCHRVIGADGKLVGYSGGIERKQWLLQHEGAILI